MILLASLMFGSYGVFSRLLGDSFAVFYQGWTRGLIITLILLPLLLYRKELIAIKKEDRSWLIIFLLFTSATQAPIFYAFNHMDIGTATLLFFVSMLLTMYLAGFLFLKEKFSTVKVISFCLAAIGLYITFSFSLAFFSLLAILAALLNGLASGGELSFSKKLSGDYSPLYLSWLGWAIIFVTNGAISFILKEPQLLPSFTIAWGYQLAYAVAGMAGFWAMITGLKYIESSIGGLLGLLEVVFSIALGTMIFHEGLTTRVVVGGILILAAAA